MSCNMCVQMHVIHSLQITHVIQLKWPFLHSAGMKNDGGGIVY